MRKFEIATDLQIFDSCILPPEFLNTVVNAEEVVRVAHERSQAIIQQAEIEKQNIIAKSRTEAEEKLQDLRNQMWKEFEAAKGQVVAEMYKKMEDFLVKFRASMPHLVETILFRIIGEFDAQELSARCIAMGIEEMRDATEMVIRVNPAEEATLRELLQPWLRDNTASGGFVRMENDHFIPEGQAVIITEIGSVELSVKDQILAFTDNLKKQFIVHPDPDENNEE
ncbi:MAG: type III secretion system stator protein SctL [Pseudomonadota bacterium]